MNDSPASFPVRGPAADWLRAFRPLTVVARTSDACPVCRKPMTLGRYVAMTGEQFCTRHSGRAMCLLCHMPSAVRGDLPLCRRCAATSVRTQQDVKRQLPPITAQLQVLGIRSTVPVQVEVVPQVDLTAAIRTPGHGQILGATVSRGSDVVRLMVLRDLPLMKFGSTVAHEVMHTYMTQQVYPRLSPPVAEGICQLLAFAWIRRQSGPLAVAEQRHIEDHRDPVYGGGFQAARSAAARVGVSRMLQHVRRTGEFP